MTKPTKWPVHSVETYIWVAKNPTHLYFIFFYLGFMAHQDYLTHFEPSQSLGGTKTGDPQEKTPDHP